MVTGGTMKNICAWCNRNINTKQLACFTCGDALTGAVIRMRVAPDTVILCCSDCGNSHSKAKTTVSHGICPECETKFEGGYKR